LTNLVRGAKENSILIGDFNLPEINWRTGEATTHTRDFVEAVEDANMVQLVEFPTLIEVNCLDLVITNMPERVIEAREMGRLGASVHEIILVRMETGLFQPAKKRVINWRRTNWDSVRQEVGAIDWPVELQGKGTNEMWEILKGKIHAMIKNNVPWKEINGRGRPVWMTKEVMAALRRKIGCGRRQRKDDNSGVQGG
jgi:hypothetical protein